MFIGSNISEREVILKKSRNYLTFLLIVPVTLASTLTLFSPIQSPAKLIIRLLLLLIIFAARRIFLKNLNEFLNTPVSESCFSLFCGTTSYCKFPVRSSSLFMDCLSTVNEMWSCQALFKQFYCPDVLTSRCRPDDHCSCFCVIWNTT